MRVGEAVPGHMGVQVQRPASRVGAPVRRTARRDSACPPGGPGTAVKHAGRGGVVVRPSCAPSGVGRPPWTVPLRAAVENVSVVPSVRCWCRIGATPRPCG
jgi:hypothetical protein